MDNKRIKVTVTLPAEVERSLRGLALYNDFASFDQIVSKAIRVAAKDKGYQEWLEENSSALDEQTETRTARKAKAGTARAA